MNWSFDFFHYKKDVNLNAIELRKRDLFIRISVFSCLTIGLYFVVNFAQGRYNSSTVNFLILGSFVANLFYYKNSGKYDRSLIVYLIITLCGISVQHFFSVETSRGHLLWYPFVVFLTCFMMDKKYLLKMTLLTTLTALTMEYANSLHAMTLDSVNPDKVLAMNLSSGVISLFIAYLVGMSIKKTESMTLSHLDSSNRKHRELSDSNAMLVSILSHDLANHIHSVHSYSKILLKRGQLNAVDRNKINKLFNTAITMKSLVEEVRQLKANEHGHLAVPVSSIELQSCLLESINSCRSLANCKNVNLRLEKPLYGINISADSVSIVNSVFNNIITNAIKFSPRGGKIDIFIEDFEYEVTVNIQDYGTGMDEQTIDSLFSKHRPVSALGTEGERGTGLGIPIIKMYMDKYDGRINVKSSTEKGSSGTLFSLTFHKTACAIRKVA